MDTSKRLTREQLKTKLLVVIALGGPSTFYELTRKRKIAANTSVLEALQDLQEEGLIEPGPIGSRKRTPYRLTFPGLLAAISQGGDEVKQNLDTIMKSWSSLEPFILGRWPSILKHVRREEAERRLREVAEKTYKEWVSEAKLREIRAKFTEEEGDSLEERFRRSFFMGTAFPALNFQISLSVEDYSPAWVKLAVEDREIREYLIELLTEMVKTGEEGLNWMNQFLESLKRDLAALKSLEVGQNGPGENQDQP